MVMSGLLPRAKEVITDDDIQSWVSAGLHAAMPLMFKETREVLLFAMQEHQKVLAEQTMAMMRTMEVQSIAMQRTIETQGRMVSRLIAFGGLTAIFSQIWQELPVWLRSRRWIVACSYGLGVGTILVCV
eukprot:TRINITY_DN98152_c0_g1_i1.p1 TRINITY_DN98152_c0_g1~~TRINITY_DN98152_c0_g1_i1.p1  ORF type:complete len:129 (-),score=12.89 TRINITY_DN98152_c0_g1_i1:166-552(-)